MAQNRPHLGPTGSGGQLSQFDLLLAAIPLALVAGVGSTFLVWVPQFAGIAMGAAVAGCLVGYGMYALSKTESTSSSPTQSESASRSETRFGEHVQRAE